MYWIGTLLLFLVSNSILMAQNSICLNNTAGAEVLLVGAKHSEKKAAALLKKYLDQSVDHPFLLSSEPQKDNSKTNIILQCPNESSLLQGNDFIIHSDKKNIYLKAKNDKTLRYAVYTLLEYWGFRKYTAKVHYIPKLKQLYFPANHTQAYKASFEYRYLFYPDAYDPEFRDWHKLDWHRDDFGIWGHSFYELLRPSDYFQKHPEYFALYEGQRNAASLCMTNQSALDIICEKITTIIEQKPEAQFFSISQNDEAVYCNCEACDSLNQNYGGPQGSLYFFLNKIARRFPKTKFSTLAYAHTYRAPEKLSIAPNIHTLFCPIELNRAKAITENPKSAAILEVLKKWGATNAQLFLWDYTVEFTNYLSPFPNWNSFSKNYQLFEQQQLKGLFVQGYADVPGDFYELRQYLLAKLLWNSRSDLEELTNDFLKGFYGDGAPFIKKYLDLLMEYQQQSDHYLDIYTDPIQGRNSFLSLKAMDQYDKLLSQAEKSVQTQAELQKRVLKLRLALEYVYFEQSKFYGKEPYGMFWDKEQGKSLRERVYHFTKACNEFGIYELSEAGLSPDQYYEEWLNIEKNSCSHLGEKFPIRFLTPVAPEYSGKGAIGLVDGLRGYKNPAINWIGWYGNNPEIALSTNKLDFNQIRINTLSDQRHWIFTPKKISIYGWKKDNWELITQSQGSPLTENTAVSIKTWELDSKNFRRYSLLKIVIENQTTLPAWRKRKHKKPMVMLDEIELYKT